MALELIALITLGYVAFLVFVLALCRSSAAREARMRRIARARAMRSHPAGKGLRVVRPTAPPHRRSRAG